MDTTPFDPNGYINKCILNIRFFEANKKFNPQFTKVNEELNFAVERRKSNG
jgi:hypothetical protein